MIIKNIIEFLKGEEQLYINDLGLFKKIYKGAVVEGNQLHPPHYYLVLEESDTGNGFAFILFISKQEKLRIVDADIAIKTWIDNIKKQIAEQGFAYFENFGKFTQGKEGFVFESDTLEELNRDFEGMSSVELPNVAKKEVDKAENVVEAKTTITDSEGSSFVDDENSTDGYQPTTTKSRKWVGWFFFVLTILFSFLFLVFIFYDTIELKIEEWKWKKTLADVSQIDSLNSRSNVQITDSLNDTLDVDSLNPPFSLSDTSQVLQENALVDEKKSDFSFANNKFEKIRFEKGKYYVIAGSFDTERRAVEHAILKQKQGLTPKLLYQEYVSKIRICVGIYDTEEEALKAIPQGNDFWILQ